MIEILGNYYNPYNIDAIYPARQFGDKYIGYIEFEKYEISIMRDTKEEVNDIIQDVLNQINNGTNEGYHPQVKLSNNYTPRKFNHKG